MNFHKVKETHVGIGHKFAKFEGKKKFGNLLCEEIYIIQKTC